MDLSFWPRLNKCCCCLSLRTGSLIVGYASLLTSGFSMGGVSFSLHRLVQYVREHRGTASPGGHSPQEVQRVALSLYVSHAYFLLVLLYYCVISLLLVVGVHRNKPSHLRLYCSAALLLLALASALVVVTLVFFGLVAAVPLLKWCIILFYCIIVVRSAYIEMEELNKPQVYELKNMQNPDTQQAAALI